MKAIFGYPRVKFSKIMGLKSISILTLSLVLGGCESLPSPDYAVSETKRPDGTYGAWETKERTDAFSSYTFSTVEGKAVRGENFGDSAPRIVVQDDFVINLYTGDGYICKGTFGGIWVDRIFRKSGLSDDSYKHDFDMPDSPYDLYNHNYWLVADSGDHIEIKGKNSKTNQWLYALNKYDSVFFQYTDECGEQKVLEFDISGTHHNKTSIVTPIQ
jgi:hypothetical protein|tara:strand:- start:145 stop:789 length:645 start_codon:yes stop_codon:yes gene_type:complete